MNATPIPTPMRIPYVSIIHDAGIEITRYTIIKHIDSIPICRSEAPKNRDSITRYRGKSDPQQLIDSNNKHINTEHYPPVTVNFEICILHKHPGKSVCKLKIKNLFQSYLTESGS